MPPKIAGATRLFGNDDGLRRCTYDIEQAAVATRTTVTHEISGAQSRFIGDVSNGWPIVISR